MHDHQNPWRWAMAVGLVTAALWAVVFVVPPQWFAFIFHIKNKRVDALVTVPSTWLVLHPPMELRVDSEPEMQITPEPENEPEPFIAQDWWSQSVGISVVTKLPVGGTAISLADSISYILNHLGLDEDFMTRAQPDSLLAEKLFLLQLEDSFEFSEEKPYLNALGRAKDYEDIMSRAAAMYDEFLNTNIMVPE